MIRRHQYELDRNEIGYSASLALDVENCHTRWGGEGYIRHIAEQAEGSAERQWDNPDHDRHINPWGPE